MENSTEREELINKLRELRRLRRETGNDELLKDIRAVSDELLILEMGGDRNIKRFNTLY